MRRKSHYEHPRVQGACERDINLNIAKEELRKPQDENLTILEARLDQEAESDKLWSHLWVT